MTRLVGGGGLLFLAVRGVEEIPRQRMEKGGEKRKEKECDLLILRSKEGTIRRDRNNYYTVKYSVGTYNKRVLRSGEESSWLVMIMYYY